MEPCFCHSTNQQANSGGQSPSSLIKIRTTQPGDLSAIADILVASFHNSDGDMPWLYPLLRIGIYEDLRMRLRYQTPHSICLVATRLTCNRTIQSESLVGTVEMSTRSTYSWQKSSQYLYISNLAVDKSFRRQGIAKKLLQACEKAALDWGFQDIYLHVLDNNYQARQLYLKLGYQLHKTEINWTSYLFKHPQKLMLHKHLNSKSC